MKWKILLGVGLACAQLARAEDDRAGTAAGGPLDTVAWSATEAGAKAFPTDEEIRRTYGLLAEHHARHLAGLGVKLPALRKPNGDYTLAALVLVYLARGYPDVATVSKAELTRFIRSYDADVNDVQQARHLAAQSGWYILSGTRNDDRTMDVRAGEYRLITLEAAYPGFNAQRRADWTGPDYWERLQEAFGYRCATCGSLEGEPHLHWPETLTVLQKGHMDPARPLEPGNVIPQCLPCNQASRDFWIFDDKGRVAAVANPAVIDRSPEEIQRRIYARLYRKYGGKNPAEIGAPAEAD